MKKGLSYQATNWPSEGNSWAGRFACNGCNNAVGDSSCTVQIPILCILHAKTIDRPYYEFYPDFTTYSNPDAAHY